MPEKPSQQQTPPARRQWQRALWLALAGFCIAAGAVGVVLPGLPTTPFLLVAAWAAPKGSPRLARWLETHPTYGPMLHAWRTERAVPRRAKVIGVCLMVISWTMLWWMQMGATLLAISGLGFLVLATLLLTRAEPSLSYSRDLSEGDDD